MSVISGAFKHCTLSPIMSAHALPLEAANSLSLVPQEASASSSANELESEEEVAPPAPTPPLFNGHAILHDTDDCCNGEQMKDETLNDGEPLISHETNRKEDFHSLLHAYKENSMPAKEQRDHTPLSDEEELAGVSVKQLVGLVS